MLICMLCHIKMYYLQAETQHLEMKRLMKQGHSGSFSRQGIEELQKISQMHLLLGNLHRYCEILIEMGEVRLFFFKIFLEDISPFCGATDTPVLDFWWRFPWVSKPGGPLACMLSHLRVMNSWDSPLVRHLLTSWWPAWQPVAFPTCL